MLRDVLGIIARHFSVIAILIIISSILSFANAVWNSKRSAILSKSTIEQKSGDWQPVQAIESKVEPTLPVPVIKFSRSEIEDQVIPNIATRGRKIISYRHITGVRLTINIKNLFGNGMSRLPIVNGVDRDIELDGLINEMKREKLFISPSETFVHLYDNFVIIEYSGDKQKLNDQIQWFTTRLSLRFKINLVESNKL